MTFPSRLCIFPLICSLLAIVVIPHGAVAQSPPSGMIVLDNTGTLTIEEGTSGRFNVDLSVAPNADVIIALASDNTDVSVSPTSLTFTTTNWDTAQEVTVSVADDDGADDETATITLSAIGGITATAVEKDISVEDDETAALLLSARALAILEGGRGYFEVRPATRPTADIKVTITVPSSSGIGIDTDLSTPGIQNMPLTFKRDGQQNAWNTYRRVVVFSALDDTNQADHSVDITLSAAADDPNGSSDYDNETETVSLGVRVRPRGNFILDIPRTLAFVEGDSQTFEVSLDTEPNDSAIIDFDHSLGASYLVISPPSLTFTPANYDRPQRVTFTPLQNRDDLHRSGTFTVKAISGIRAPAFTSTVDIANAPPRGRIVLSQTDRLIIPEGQLEVLTVNLDTRPTGAVYVALESDHLDVTASPSVLTFTETNYAKARTVVIISEQDRDRSDEDVTITFSATGGIRAPGAMIEVIVIDDDETTPDWPVKTQALALPSTAAQDDATMRLYCKEKNRDCAVHLACAAQSDGSVYEGSILSVPANGALTLTVSDIERTLGGSSWSNKGRLGCALHSEQTISAQVWTRSGDGVLVNNSAFIRSIREGEMYRADIESIPSPDEMEESNIRIRCTSAITASHCAVSLACYDDAGRRYDGDLGAIGRLRVRHLQRDELSRLIGHRWSGLGLSCEIRSDRIFTVQVMTRTGGGGALVNNSATGGR